MIIASSIIIPLDASSRGENFAAYKKYQENLCRYRYKQIDENNIRRGSAITTHGVTTLQTARHLIGQFPLGITYALYGTGEIIVGSGIATFGCIEKAATMMPENHKEIMGGITITGMIACMLSDKIKFTK